MAIDLDAQRFQPLLECVGRRLGAVMGNAHAAHIQPDPPECIDQAQHIQVVGDAQIAPALIFLNIAGADDDDDLRRFLHLQQHFYLAVRRKARQYPGSMVIVKQLAAEFQIQLAAELPDPLPDFIRLHFQVFFVVKPDFEHGLLLFLLRPL